MKSPARVVLAAAAVVGVSVDKAHVLKSPAKVFVAAGAGAVVVVSVDKAYVLKSPAKVFVAAGAGAVVVVVSVDKSWVLKSPARVASERSERALRVISWCYLCEGASEASERARS